MTIYAAAGSKLFIGGEFTIDGDVETTDFAGETWVEVKQLEGLGSLGDASEEITFDDIGKRRRQRLKGVRNAEPMEIVAGLDHADPGQAAIFAAERSDANFDFRVVFDDARTSAHAPFSRITRAPFTVTTFSILSGPRLSPALPIATSFSCSRSMTAYFSSSAQNGDMVGVE